MNDSEREDWVLNDEGLYDAFRRWRRTRSILRKGASMRTYVREHRALIDEVAGEVSTGAKRQSYLKYG